MDHFLVDSLQKGNASETGRFRTNVILGYSYRAFLFLFLFLVMISLHFFLHG